ncbi:serine hydrolase domain-containing protein [Marinoscillum sp.]|uniref:serine hydrolase domain-containing protein n=1 Tax=Marinoscillum sp. TaxID=2024838 RepID=UPI003BA9A538
MRNLSLIIWTICLSACYVSDDLPPDQKAWQYDLPSSVGLSNLELTNLDLLIESRNFGQVNGMVIIKDDHLIFENYYNGTNRQTIHEIGRATCAVAVLTLGKLIEDGLIANLDVPIANFLPEYEDIFNAEPRKRNITFRHILENKMGIPWNEYTVNTSTSKSQFYQMKRESDWVRFVLSQTLEADPGLRIVLNSGSAMVLSKVFENILLNETLEEYIDRNIFKPIGITNYEWVRDPSGSLDLATGLSISTLDFTRIGYLMQQEGRWSDRKRVIDRFWILDATQLVTPFLENFGFGYYWWVFTDAFNEEVFNGLRTYSINGYAGQCIYVAPDDNLVVCIMADNPYSDSVYNPSLDIYRRILTAVTTTTEDNS